MYILQFSSGWMDIFGILCLGIQFWGFDLGIRWSARAIKSFGMAELEARKLKYPNTGTEALLMGILVEG